jgi:hypothetical protein
MVMATRMGEPDPLKEVRETLSGLDPASVAAAAGALSLLPENGNRLGRLGHLAVLAGELAPGPPSRIGRGRLGQLVNAGALARIAASQDDPYEDVLVEEVAFIGGPRRLGAGLAENAVYVLRRLMPSVLAPSVLAVDEISEDTRSELLTTIDAALRVSDRILRDVGPALHARPLPDDGTLTVPSAARLAAMSAAVTFTNDELDELAGTDARAALAPLIREAEHRSSPADWILKGEGDRWPLLAFGDTIVVAQPYGIAAALRHHILCAAAAEAGVGPVAVAFGESVDTNVRFSLARMEIDATVVRKRTADHAVTVFSAELDTGLTMCCAVVTDTMADLASGGIYGHYRSHAENAAAERAFADAAAATDGQVLGLLVQQSAGRGSVAGLPRGAANLATMIIGAADLEMLALADPGDELAIWKFVSDSDALHDATRVTGFSTLDLYAIYRDQERSLRSFHEATMVVVTPGEGADIRCTATAGLDRHAAFYVDGTVREVERDTAEPWDDHTYRLSDVGEPRVVRHVGGAPVDLWVRGPEEQTGSGFGRLIDTVAYWLGELSDELIGELELLSEAAPCFTVDIDVADHDYWFALGESPDNDELGEYQLKRLGVEIRLGPMIRRLLPTADNAGERLLVGLLLDMLDEALQARGPTGISEQRKADVGNRVAPEGVKKHLLIIPGAGNELMERSGGNARLVKEADLTEARQLLGRALMHEFALPAAAQVPSAQRRKVVRRGVAYLLEVIREELAVCDPDGLLESLVAASERITADSEHARAILPAREATYPSAVSNARLREQAASFTQAGVCCRFLIECVAAQPPSGSAPWSLRRYDRLMALCAVMLAWAYLDDAYQFEMSDNDVLINSDGELRLVDLDRYERGRSVFYDQYLEGQRRLASDVFALRFAGAGRDATPSPVLTRVDPAMQAEAGVSLTDLRELLHAANGYARSLDAEVVAVDRARAITELAKFLEWDTDTVDKGVTYLTMGARAELLKPPIGGVADVIPSRFARRWSLNRRPFIERGDQLVWGRRQVLVALRVIFTQVFSGRFQALAETDELRDVLSAVGSEAGYAFEKEVADVVDGHVDVVRLSVTTVNGHKIARDNGEALGDIDVLVADQAHKLVAAMEVKDLAGALTPTEVAGELKEHFDISPGTSSSKHRERTDWLAGHIGDVLAELSITSDPTGWRVVGVFVTSTSVMAPHIKDTDFDIVSARNVLAWLDDQRAASKRRTSANKGKRRRRGRGRR